MTSSPDDATTRPKHTDEFDLPQECDVCIIGTGLTQSILAAACSKRGRNVLHLDASTSYGGAFGAFKPSCDPGKLFESDEALTETTHRHHAVFGACVDATTGRVILERLSRLRSDADSASSAAPTRGYSIDLNAPRLVLGADAFCESIVRSGAHRYLEFKAVERTFVYMDGCARAVASNRSDVFKDATLSGAEKRALMRFLKLVHSAAMSDEVARRRSGKNGEETNVAVGAPGSEWGGNEIVEEDGLRAEKGERMDAFLTRHGLSEKLKAAVMYALALQTRADCDAVEALEALKVYISSVAKYGPQTGACLIPLYGVGDIPQAFCRVGAVEGATFILRQGMKGVTPNADAVTSMTSVGGQDVRVKHVVAPAPPGRATGTLAHAVCILDSPLVSSHDQVFVVFPPHSVRAEQKSVVRALQIGSHTGCCPDGRYLLYLSNLVDDGCDEDPFVNLNAVLDIVAKRGDEDESKSSVFGAEEERRPTILWGTTYTQACCDEPVVECASPNVILCPAPDDAATFNGTLRTAEMAYSKLFGDEELFEEEIQHSPGVNDDDDANMDL